VAFHFGLRPAAEHFDRKWEAQRKETRADENIVARLELSFGCVNSGPAAKKTNPFVADE